MPFKPFRLAVLAPLMLLLGGCNLVVMNPAGDVATRQANLILWSTGLMLLIIVPVILFTLFFAWKYRASNRDATYDPEWNHSTKLEVLIWTAPLMIIIALGAMTWLFTHLLDPYRPLTRIAPGQPVTEETRTLTVEVVALDWKWMFIYPELGIATVNELAAPVDTPIAFRLTSSSIMNSFYIPALSGMIYAMPGMQTQLHAVINREGTYEGIASNYSGPGFSNMHFKFLGMSQDGFDEWVARVRAQGQPLTRERYLEVEAPSEMEPVHYYSQVDRGLFRAILNMCVEPGRMCMDEMMHIDMQGGGGLDSLHHMDRLIYDTNRAHDSHFGHGPSGYAGAGEAGGAEAPGATFPASDRRPRSEEPADDAAPQGAPHEGPHEGPRQAPDEGQSGTQNGSGQSGDDGPAPGSAAPDQLQN